MTPRKAHGQKSTDRSYPLRRVIDMEKFSQQLQSSSTLSFSRSLFDAAEGKELFKGGFTFASAVSTYYSVFHLGGALILTYCSVHPPPGDLHADLRAKLKKEWQKRQMRTLSNGQQYLADPAIAISHADVPSFLDKQFPEIFACLGGPDKRGTLRNMREFVSYAPRMVNDGRINVLYSGCQYGAEDFKVLLGNHLSRIDELFYNAMAWLRQGCYSEIFSKILSGDFVLYEFDELRSYHPPSVVASAWTIYRKICDREHHDWTAYRPNPYTFHTDELDQQHRYEQIVHTFESH